MVEHPTPADAREMLATMADTAGDFGLAYISKRQALALAAALADHEGREAEAKAEGWAECYRLYEPFASRVAAAEAEVAALRTQLDEAVRLLGEARAMVNEWASYASDYFKEKWDLAGDLAMLDVFLSAAALNKEEQQ